MPHIVVEYTANLGEQARMPALLKQINTLLIRDDGMFPTGGIRSRAIELQHWCIADGGNADDAFVHVSAKIGRGRSDAEKKAVFDPLFEVVKEHFASVYATRGLALSMELNEFSEAGTWKHNNIHARFRKS
jgi:5-carboxymethyl-2-hydroxymuconate isomerase